MGQHALVPSGSAAAVAAVEQVVQTLSVQAGTAELEAANWQVRSVQLHIVVSERLHIAVAVTKRGINTRMTHYHITKFVI